MLESELMAKLYMEPRPLTEEWLHTLLFRLWERGLHYNHDYAAEPLTWDEELHVLADGYVDDKKIYGEINKDVQLGTLIQRIAAAGGGLIMVYDKDVQYQLTFQLSVPYDDDALDEFPARFGPIIFTVGGYYINTDHQLPLSRDLPEEAYLLAPYQQTMLAFAHWMEVLCEECRPVFAVGYDSNRELDEEVDDRATIEAPLYEGRLPDQTAWYPLTYISPRFVDNDLILSLLNSPRRWLKRMEDGAVLIHTPYEKYAYENAEAYRHMQQAQTAKEQHEFALAIQHYQRAKGIFHRVSNEPEERLIGWNIESVDLERRIEAERKGISSQQDVLS